MPVAPWIEIPRADLDARGTWRLPGFFRFMLGLSTLVFLGIAGGLAASASFDPKVSAPILLYTIAVVFSLVGAYCLTVVATFRDRVETTPDEIRHRGLFGGLRSVPWSRIESVRARETLKRLEVHASGLSHPIRLELQLDRVDELLMVVAERTFHLLDTQGMRAAPYDGSSRRDRARAKAPEWSVEPDGLASERARISFADMTDVRIVRVGNPWEGRMVVAVQLRDGAAVAIHTGTTGLVECYQRVRRAHRAHVARSGAVPPKPSPIRQVRVPPERRRARLALAVVAWVAIAGGAVAAAGDPRAGGKLSVERDREQATVELGVSLFRSERFEEVTELAETHFATHEPRYENLALLHVQAESYRRLGRIEDAVATYLRALPIVRERDEYANVDWETLGLYLEGLAAVQHERGDTAAAVATLAEAVQLRPETGSGTSLALLGAWYQDLGDAARADHWLRETLATAPPGSEAYAVAERRLRREGEAPLRDSAFGSAGVGVATGLAIAIVPFERADPRYDLSDVCAVLESRLRIPCTVLPVQRLRIELVLDPERDQVDGARMLALLHAGLPKLAPSFPVPEDGLYLLGVTARDMFAGSNRFVFSYQNPELRVAVMSSHHLVGELPGYWPAEALAGRRMAIQALSAVGMALGLDRPAEPHCPLAYPNSSDAFLMKGGRLCDSTVAGLDALLEARGGTGAQLDAPRAAAAGRVERRLLLD